MIVSAYTENLFGDKSAETKLWAQQWRRFGFDPQIFDEALCRLHPRYEELKAKIRHYPTVNVRRYEDICYLRWLGVAQILASRPDGELVLQSDTDVIPFKLCPLRITSSVVRHEKDRGPGYVAVFDRGVVPCLVALDRVGAEWVIDALCTRGDQGDPYFHDGPGGAPHMSDMRLFQWLNKFVRPLVADPLCVQFGDDDKTDPRINWKIAPAVHFSAGAVGQYRPGWDKVKAMRIEILERA